MMKKVLKVLIGFVFFFLLGCASSTIPSDVYSGPKIDMDDNLSTVNVSDASGPIVSAELVDKELIPEPEPIDDRPVLSPPNLTDAKIIAKKFISAWSNKQYKIMYNYFAPKLKSRQSLEEFEAIMLLNPSYSRITAVGFKGFGSKNKKKVILNIEISTNVKSYDLPDAYMVFENNTWYVDAMDDVFYVDTFGAACGGFNKDFNKAECAKDLAIKVKDIKYCDKSECHYNECIQTINKQITTQQKVKSCNLCPPVGTTTKDCIVGVAIEEDSISVCNEIPESSYSDRYCKCYGGFSRAKGQSYCNIAPEEYRDICNKGFEGKYC